MEQTQIADGSEVTPSEGKAAENVSPESSVKDAAAKKFLTRDEVEATNDVTYEDVHVPEWGGWVKVQSLSLGQRQDVRKMSMVDGEVDDEKFDIYAFIEAVVEPEFTVDDFGMIQQKNAQAFSRIMAVVMRLAGWTVEASSEAEATFPD